MRTDFSDSKRAEIYQKIVGKYYKNEGMDFKTASEIFDFLKTAQTKDGGRNFPVELAYKRNRFQRGAKKAIPFNKGEQKSIQRFS